MSLVLLAIPGAALAQTGTGQAPDYSGVLSLFRIDLSIFGPAGQTSTAYGLGKADEAKKFLDPTVLAQRYQTYTNNSAVSGILDFRGVPFYGSYAAGSQAFVLRVPAFDEGNQPYQLVFQGQTRQDSYNQFLDYVDDINNPEAERLIRLLLKALSRYSPLDPLAGNPTSLQGSLTRSTLDLSQGDSAIEEEASGKGANGGQGPGDPWIIGFNYTHADSGRFHSDRYDGRIQRSFRVFAGNRSLLKFDLPLSYTEVNGARAATLQFGMGLEVPVIARHWSLEPRVGYGITVSDQLGSLGHMVIGSLTSRYVIEGLGRGRLVIGNMVGYSQTLSTGFTGYNINPGLKNWSTRNGVAYEMPFQGLIGGRSASIRGSYTFTKYFGDKLYSNNFHEVTMSLGLRGREESIRNARDLVRFNVTGMFARGFKAVSAGVGFRF